MWDNLSKNCLYTQETPNIINMTSFNQLCYTGCGTITEVSSVSQ